MATIEQVKDAAYGHEYGWALSDNTDPSYWQDIATEQHFADTDAARMFARDLFQRIDHRASGGTSETSLFGNVLDELRSCDDDDVLGTVDWFLRAYTVQERLEDADDATREHAFDCLFTGNLEAAEALVAA